MSAKVEKVEKSVPKPAARARRRVKQVDLSMIMTMLVVILIFGVASKFPPNITPADTKPFNTFQEFYPFYISQHADPWCRRLHFIGTTVVALMNLVDPFILPSFVMSGLLAYVVFLYTRDQSNGMIEMLAMFATFQFFIRRFGGKWQSGLAVLLIGYTFAWVGHFYFENNRPATFIYPLFSLMGDFRMWFEILSTQRAL